MWFYLLWLLLPLIILVVLFSYVYFCLCIVCGNMGIAENAETINLEHFETFKEQQSTK